MAKKLYEIDSRDKESGLDALAEFKNNNGGEGSDGSEFYVVELPKLKRGEIKEIVSLLKGPVE